MKIIHFSTLTSTNDYAKELLKKYEKIIVTADYQTAGKGRRNNIWQGDFGNNVYLSYALNHYIPIIYRDASLFQAIGCLAVLNALRRTGQHLFRLKYPNDVYSIKDGKQKKISGILIEHGFVGELCSYSIVGIGVNINQTDFLGDLSEKAISTKLLGISISVEECINWIIEEIQKLEQMGFDEIFNIWTKELNIKNKKIILKNKPGEWTAIEVLNDGRLSLKNKISGEYLVIDNGDSVFYDLV